MDSMRSAARSRFRNGLILLSGAMAFLVAADCAAQPTMGCGQIQANIAIRCTALGLSPFNAERRTLWSDLPARESLVQRYDDASECHAETEAICQEGADLPTARSNTWTFNQVLGSKGCEVGESGNGWVDPYMHWRTTMSLPRRTGEGNWLLTIVASTVTTPTIRAWPDPNVAAAPCHLLITGADTSRDLTIARTLSSDEQRHTLSRFGPGDYIVELQCPAIQGTACQKGKASLSLEVTISPDDR